MSFFQCSESLLHGCERERAVDEEGGLEGSVPAPVVIADGDDFELPGGGRVVRDSDVEHHRLGILFRGSFELFEELRRIDAVCRKIGVGDGFGIVRKLDTQTNVLLVVVVTVVKVVVLAGEHADGLDGAGFPQKEAIERLGIVLGDGAFPLDGIPVSCMLDDELDGGLM